MANLLSPRTLAEYLGVSIAWVYKGLCTDTLPFKVYRVGRLPRFKEADVELWLKAQTQPALDERTPGAARGRRGTS
jgi:excisionase family DNA binding protein